MNNLFLNSQCPQGTCSPFSFYSFPQPCQTATFLSPFSTQVVCDKAGLDFVSELQGHTYQSNSNPAFFKNKERKKEKRLFKHPAFLALRIFENMQTVIDNRAPMVVKQPRLGIPFYLSPIAPGKGGNM